MINEIIAAISIELLKEFGEDYTIYAEEEEQGLKEPFFIIFCVDPKSSIFRGRRYLAQNQLCIYYIPVGESPRAECNDITERMYSCLEYISLNGDLIRGTMMSSEFVDGVLHFFVNYDMFMVKHETKEVMGHLAESIKVR